MEKSLGRMATLLRPPTVRVAITNTWKVGTTVWGDLVLWLNFLITQFTLMMPPDTMLSLPFVVRAGIALVLVSLVCGAVGPLVVSNRMAFFSDALAHCAFSGVALGLLVALLLGIQTDAFRYWITLIMVGWGIVIGLLIAYVHEKTLLPSDTVIGVFFAGALGLAAIFSRAVRSQKYFSLENFVFGDPMTVQEGDLFWLFLLLVLTWVFLAFWYNPLLFDSFNPSLAKSRRVPVRLARYLFIVLLGIIINLCQQTVGVLLINGLLIVPGATASYLSSNLRQLLWWSLGISLFCAVFGLYLSWEITSHFKVNVGVGGMVIVLSVALFAVSMVVSPLLKSRS
jgi:zinc transport system permease protein